MVVAGARPNFMKIAPVMAALDARGHEAILVHTGQHYDAQMSDAFFADLRIRKPDHHLGVGSGSHAAQTARLMEKFEPVLIGASPDWVLVPGDVNSTLAAALVAAKLRPETGCRVAHLEAGLRSHDWRMPEEVNRVLTDRLSDILLTPSRDAHAHLASEGIDASRVVLVGNVMIDTLVSKLPEARQLDMVGRLGLERGRYVVATLHRPSNVDSNAALRTCLEALVAISQQMPVVLPVHPRTRRQVASFGLTHLLDQIRALEPLGYTELLSLTDGASAVLTDSGGLQEETTALGVQCVTLREQTERPVTITEGTNRLAPWPLTVGGIVEAFHSARESDSARNSNGTAARAPEGWDGRAAQRVVQALENGASES
jgi:UDP-N-acetylglucosamine 2-epimerase (non-hydrolysing)